MRHPSRTLMTAIFALTLPLLAIAHGSNIDKINSSVQVEAGQSVGNVSTVNGALHIADGAIVEEGSTVNGSVNLGNKGQAHKLSTVNGAITLGENSHVTGEVSTVNGSITLARSAKVDGKLDNVNGGIVLRAAHVAGGIETADGDITVGAGSHVEGGILVDKPSGWFHFGGRDPVVIIGPHAVVRGTLEFRRDVVLKVSDSAQIGPVKGATVTKFSGATPS